MLTTHTSSRFIIQIFFLACLALPARAEGPSWPQFHGPNQDNKSPDTGLLDRWPEGGPELIWKAQGLGYGYSSVSIAEGRIFTSGNIDDKTVVTALDAANGRTLWQTPNGEAWTKQVAGTRSTPTVDGDRVYDESPLGELVCLEAATGKKIWGLNILDAFGGENIFWGLSESVLIDGDRLICCPGGKTSVVALDKLTGEVVWKAPSVGQPPSYATPTLAEYQGLRMIITTALKSMIGVNADTGELLWQVEHVALHDENVLQPVYHDGEIFVSGLKTGSVKWKIKVDGRKASVEEVWRSDQMDNHHDHVILLDGYLYGSSAICNSGKWICLDWDTGEIQYAEPGVGKGTLTYADGMLYTLAERLVVGLVKPTPAGHEVVSRFELVPQGQAPSWAHPVVCGGRLYLRHAEILYVYDVAEK
ncbi:MAG TPA: PQQ-binding-like beta-propeller repeat protein [Thermoguttaceae bacterium]|nr:PQQ-binding-like beta-propeller repeat protein [Thermoguttaceae bacterium]